MPPAAYPLIFPRLFGRGPLLLPLGEGSRGRTREKCAFLRPPTERGTRERGGEASAPARALTPWRRAPSPPSPRRCCGPGPGAARRRPRAWASAWGGRAWSGRKGAWLAQLHGASVGESLSLLALAEERLRAERPGVSVLFTSGTRAAAHELLAGRLPKAPCTNTRRSGLRPARRLGFTRSLAPGPGGHRRERALAEPHHGRQGEGCAARPGLGPPFPGQPRWMAPRPAGRPRLARRLRPRSGAR